jgi:hypothetical protein
VSSATWTPRAVASEARARRLTAWRAVEAQHIASTMPLVDTLDEQHLLETLLDAGKPPVPAAARHLHWLLFTPFRYAPPPGGSRFRAPGDPGVFYAADAVRTACAELGYWRWRHLTDSPALSALPEKPQTLFSAKVAAAGVDLREPPFVAGRAHWTRPDDYTATQRFAGVARAAGVGVIRYESVRDPRQGGCCAVLSPQAFARPEPVAQQTWILRVTRERALWRRTGDLAREEYEFSAAAWSAPAAAPARQRRKP